MGLEFRSGLRSRFRKGEWAIFRRSFDRWIKRILASEFDAC